MTLSEKLMVAALLAQIVWTLVTLGLAGRARFAAMAAGRVGPEARFGRGGWPDDVLKVSNNMNNQWETPTLFYAVTLLALHLKLATLSLGVLAIVYVLSRIGHTIVQTTTNYVPHRFGMFLIGVMAIAATTLIISLDLILGTNI